MTNIKGGGEGGFATFAYSVIPEGKSLLFGHISRIFKKNGGSTASTADYRHLPPKKVFFAISRRIRHF